MPFETRKDIRGYNVKLKSKITSFLVSYRKKYDAFPIGSINKLTKHTNYKALSKLIINDVSIEPELAIKDLQERYKGIKKKLNPSYFNPVLRGFTSDAKKTTSKESMRDIYTKYSHQLDAEFKQLDLDLDFCVATLKALNKSLSEYNKKNKVVK